MAASTSLRGFVLLCACVAQSAWSPCQGCPLPRIDWTASLEIGSVDLAIANATEEQIQRLRSLAKEFKEAIAEPETEEEVLDRIELAFHSLILEMTANSLVSGMHRVLSEYFDKAAPGYPDNDAIRLQMRQEQAWEHEAIVEGFEKPDAEMTRAYLRRHLGRAI